MKKTAAKRAASTQEKGTTWVQKDVFASIDVKPISIIGLRDVLAAVQKMEPCGAIDSAHRTNEICGQVFRFAVATGLAEGDITADLRRALSAVPRANYAAITEPKRAGDLMTFIYAYSGHIHRVVFAFHDSYVQGASNGRPAGQEMFRASTP